MTISRTESRACYLFAKVLSMSNGCLTKREKKREKYGRTSDWLGKPRMEGRRRGRKLRNRESWSEREEKGRLGWKWGWKMKGEVGPFPTWFMFYTPTKGLGMGRARGHRAAKVTVRSGKLFESFQSFRFVLASIPKLD